MGILDFLFGKKRKIEIEGVGKDLVLVAGCRYIRTGNERAREFFIRNKLPDNKFNAFLLELFIYRLSIGFYWIDRAYSTGKITEEENSKINYEIQEALAELLRPPGFSQFFEERTSAYRMSYHEDYREVTKYKPGMTPSGMIPFRRTTDEIIKCLFGEDKIPLPFVEMSIYIGSDAIVTTPIILRTLKDRNIL